VLLRVLTVLFVVVVAKRGTEFPKPDFTVAVCVSFFFDLDVAPWVEDAFVLVERVDGRGGMGRSLAESERQMFLYKVKDGVNSENNSLNIVIPIAQASGNGYQPRTPLNLTNADMRAHIHLSSRIKA
jgi:hypothetical protein